MAAALGLTSAQHSQGFIIGSDVTKSEPLQVTETSKFWKLCKRIEHSKQITPFLGHRGQFPGCAWSNQSLVTFVQNTTVAFVNDHRYQIFWKAALNLLPFEDKLLQYTYHINYQVACIA